MPSQMGFDYMGMSYQEQKAAQGVSPAVVFGMALFVVFLIMAAQYESWTLPFSVLLGLPIAIFGAFMTLYFRRFDNDVYAQIGLVMLIGLSSKNAILIVEFAKLEYDKGKSLIDATLTGARLRLRPILMTAFAFILGCVPLWRANGAGAISRQVLGTTVIGGMLAATIIAIFFIPVSFDVVERFGALFGGKEAHGQPPPPATRSSTSSRKGAARMIATKTPTRTSSLGLDAVALAVAAARSGPTTRVPLSTSPDSIAASRPICRTAGRWPFGETKWETVFQDETLQALIKEALTNNYDIRIAATPHRAGAGQSGNYPRQPAPHPQWRRRHQERAAPRSLSMAHPGSIPSECS